MTEDQDLPGLDNENTCLTCGRSPPLVNHHTSYEPEKVVQVCGDCHWKLHNRPDLLLHEVGKENEELFRSMLRLEDVDLDKSLYRRTRPGNNWRLEMQKHAKEVEKENY